MSITLAQQAALIAAVPRYAWFDQIAVSCGISWFTLRAALVDGVTRKGSEYADFAQQFWAADAALSRRVHELLTTGSLELEVKDLPPGAIPGDLGERIDEHWGPVMSEIMRKARALPIVMDESGVQVGAKVSVRLKPPQQKALADWAAKRWPASEHVASIMPLLESKEVKRRALVDSMRNPTPELQAAQNEAGLVRLTPEQREILRQHESKRETA